MEWQNLFAQRILNRGRQYYLGGKIKGFNVEADAISASIEGSEDYTVDITLEHGVALSMHCTCPYAQKGENCKHMAAVLFQYAQSTGAGEEILDEEQVIARVDTLMQHYLWDRPFVPANQCYGFSHEMRKLLRKEVKDLSYSAGVMAAFRVTSYIMVNVEKVIGNPHDDFVYGVLVLCRTTWSDLIEAACNEEKYEIMDWLIQAEDRYGEEVNFHIRQILSENFDGYQGISNRFQKTLQRFSDGNTQQQNFDNFRSKFFTQRAKKKALLADGDTEAYIKALRELVTKYVPRNLMFFRELKAQYDRETWLAVREEIFAELANSPSLGYLYREEQIYDRLLDFVKQSRNFLRLYEHLDKLKEIYPEDALELYREFLLVLSAESYGSREEYRQWIEWAFDLREFEGGEAALQQVIETWEAKYQRRGAMMDELEQRKEREGYV